jgi:hypothetical protein
VLTAAVPDSRGQCQRAVTGMSRLPIWAEWSIAMAVLLLSPVFGLLTAIGVEILIGALKETGALALLAAAVGAIGWSLLRKLCVRPRGSAPMET